jgi:hypothetical protein
MNSSTTYKGMLQGHGGHLHGGAARPGPDRGGDCLVARSAARR